MKVLDKLKINKHRARIAKVKYTNSKKGRLVKITKIDQSTIKGVLNNGNSVTIRDNWINNNNPIVLYEREGNRVIRNSGKLQYPKKVYSYWTPFLIDKYIYVEDIKDGKATFIRGK